MTTGTAIAVVPPAAAAGRGRGCRAGRDRAGSGRALRPSTCSSAGLAVRRLDDRIALRRQADAQQLADRRLVVDDQDLDGRTRSCRIASRSAAPGDRHPDGEDRAASVGPVAGGDRAAHRLDEAAADRQPEPGAGAHAVAFPRAVELAEHPLQILRRRCPAPRPGPAASPRRRRRPTPGSRIGDSGVGIFGGIVEQVEQHLLEQDRVDPHHRQVGRQIDLDLCAGEDLPGPRRAPCRRCRRRSRQPKFGSIAPDSILVMSSRLAMKRLSRSDSSMHGAEQIPLGRLRPALRRNSRSVPAAPMIEASGVFRSCEIEVSSAERRRSASAASLALSRSSTSLTRSMASAAWSVSASMQPPLLRRQQRPLAVVVDADDADRRRAPCATAGRGAWRRAACRRRGRPARSFSQAQLGGGDVGLVERVVGRIAGLDGDRAVLRQEQHDAHLQHRGDLEGGRPQHVVERAGAGELLAEQDRGLRSSRARCRAATAWPRTRAVRLLAMTATTRKKTKVTTLSGLARWSACRAVAGRRS